MNSPVPPITDHLAVAIRAYAAPTIHTYETLTGKPRRKASKRSASPWVVIFDTETTSDAAQSLRFGTFPNLSAALWIGPFALRTSW